MRPHTANAIVIATAAAALVASCSNEPRTSAQATALAIAASDPSLKWGPCPPIFPAGCTIAVLQGDPSKPNADVFLRVPGKYEIPAHWHTSPERMVLVTGRLEVTYKGQAATTLETGTYAYGPAKQPHKGVCLSDDPCTLFIAFEGAVDGHAGGLE